MNNSIPRINTLLFDYENLYFNYDYALLNRSTFMFQHSKWDQISHIDIHIGSSVTF